MKWEWEEYLYDHRFKHQSVFDKLDKCGLRQVRIWDDNPSRSAIGRDKWYKAWGDIVEIASQVLGEEK